MYFGRGGVESLSLETNDNIDSSCTLGGVGVEGGGGGVKSDPPPY